CSCAVVRTCGFAETQRPAASSSGTAHFAVSSAPLPFGPSGVSFLPAIIRLVPTGSLCAASISGSSRERSRARRTSSGRGDTTLALHLVPDPIQVRHVDPGVGPSGEDADPQKILDDAGPAV